MKKRFTNTLDERVYSGLHNVVGRRGISHFIESLVRRHVLSADSEAAYRRLADEEARESEALEWAEANLADVADEMSEV
jgi:hypothetical protein